MNFDQIPAELKVLPQWVDWKIVIRDGKPAKMPFTPGMNDGAEAGVPETWRTFEQALASHVKTKRNGIGFEFATDGGIFGIDLDNCLVDDSPELEAAEIMLRFNTYQERSQSKKGIHIIGRGKKPGKKCRKGKIEIYDQERYFIMTGDILPGASPVIKDCQEALDWLYAKLFKTETARECGSPGDSVSTKIGSLDLDPTTPHAVCQESLPDDYILKCCRDSGAADKFAKLWEGSTVLYDGDESRRDMALTNFLARWTKDSAQIDRLFRSSGCMRSKWDERRGEQTYGELTIREALRYIRDEEEARSRLDKRSEGALAQATELVAKERQFLEEILGLDIIHYADGEKRYAVKFKSRPEVETTLEILVNFFQFRILVGKALDFVPPMVKQIRWDERINFWLTHADHVYRSRDESLIGLVAQAIRAAIILDLDKISDEDIEKNPRRVKDHPSIFRGLVVFGMEWVLRELRFAPEKVTLKSAGAICRNLGYESKVFRIEKFRGHLWFQDLEKWKLENSDDKIMP